MVIATITPGPGDGDLETWMFRCKTCRNETTISLEPLF